jgi:hypothetical protein
MATIRRHTTRWTMTTLAGVALGTSACGWFASSDAEALGNQAVTILESLGAEPYEGDRFDITETNVKLDATYVATQGVHRHDPEATIDELAAALEAEGFDITSNQPVDYSLGHEILATDGRQVARSILGPGIEHVAAYPPLDDGTYVVITVANANSGPDWADVTS